MKPIIRIEKTSLLHPYSDNPKWKTESYDYEFEDAVIAKRHYGVIESGIDKGYEQVSMEIVFVEEKE